MTTQLAQVDRNDTDMLASSYEAPPWTKGQKFKIKGVSAHFMRIDADGWCVDSDSDGTTFEVASIDGNTVELKIAGTSSYLSYKGTTGYLKSSSTAYGWTIYFDSSNGLFYIQGRHDYVTLSHENDQAYYVVDSKWRYAMAFTTQD